jgi:hypothetical protein
MVAMMPMVMVTMVAPRPDVEVKARAVPVPVIPVSVSRAVPVAAVPVASVAYSLNARAVAYRRLEISCHAACRRSLSRCREERQYKRGDSRNERTCVSHSFDLLLSWQHKDLASADAAAVSTRHG